MLPFVVSMPMHHPKAFPEADTLARTLIESGTTDVNAFQHHFGKGETTLQKYFGHHFATGLSEYASTTIAQEGRAVFRKTIKRFVQGVSWLPLDLYTLALHTLTLQLAAKSEEFSIKTHAVRGARNEGYLLSLDATQRITRMLGESATFSLKHADALRSIFADMDGPALASPVARPYSFKHTEVPPTRKMSP